MTLRRFSASSVEQQMACHASAELEVAIPGFEMPEVDETAGAKGKGTRLHNISEDIVNELTPAEMVGFARGIAYVAKLRQRRRFTKHVEKELTAEWLDTKPSTKVDLALSTKDELHVVDYKWGRIPVPVVNNGQLLFYAASIAEEAPKAKGVHLHIVQPFDPGWDEATAEWYVTADELAAFMDDARAHEAAIQGGDRSFGPSEHCTFCPANPHSRGDKGRPLCPAMMQVLYPTPPIDIDEVLNG